MSVCSTHPTAATPQVSVVMPVYNGQLHLRQALASILAQDYRNFELIVVNDGSTDESATILAQFAARDPRVRVIQQPNRGLVGALNRGLQAVRGPLIARMDADDIAMPQRFSKQVQYLKDHPATLAVGTAILNMDSDGDPLNVQVFAADPETIDHCLMNRRTGMAHPSVMMRRAAVEAVGGYRTEFEWIEDHDLWLRLSERGPLGNLPDVLLCYRQHLNSCSWNNATLRTRRINGVMTAAYRRRQLPMPPNLLLDEANGRSAGGPHKWMRSHAIRPVANRKKTYACPVATVSVFSGHLAEQRRSRCASGCDPDRWPLRCTPDPHLYQTTTVPAPYTA